MKLIDGKAISAEIKAEIKTKVSKMIDAGERTPHLAAILVGSDPASQTYVASKERACKACGITSSLYSLPENTSEEELINTIEFINSDSEIDGLIVQLPLPKHINEDKIIQHINPAIDVDGFHPLNIGKMVTEQPTFLPATPMGIMELLKRSNIETAGKHAVVIGRSNIVGTPMSILLSRKTEPGNCTVTLCHSRTKNLEEICQTADIIVAAIGKPNFVTAKMVKAGAIIIDVGIHRVPAENTKKGYQIIGDVDFLNVAEKCSYITPVPGGVGPTTIASLLLNTLKSYENKKINHK